MKHILLDTDILLDFFLQREPFADDAEAIISLCEEKKMIGYITPVICSNLYYMLRKGRSHQFVMEKMTLFLTYIDVLIIDKNTILEAINSDFSDFEDALQNYAAQDSSFIDAIITRNTPDYKHSQIPVLTPSNFLAIS